MNNLKFRFWDKKNNRFLGPYKFSELPDFIANMAYDDFDETFDVHQFTGLFDDKGVEIYEGDLVKTKFYNGWFDKIGYEDVVTVFFNPERGAFVYALYPDKFKAGQTFDPYTMDPLELEVVGNIHENV